ncbi:MAG: hypothetical protein NZ805_16200, partial [Armatimonadetes bacterium]|nr:hypothetical protein [Armatimonadota bacterium]
VVNDDNPSHKVHLSEKVYHFIWKAVFPTWQEKIFQKVNLLAHRFLFQWHFAFESEVVLLACQFLFTVMDNM